MNDTKFKIGEQIQLIGSKDNPSKPLTVIDIVMHEGALHYVVSRNSLVNTIPMKAEHIDIICAIYLEPNDVLKKML